MVLIFFMSTITKPHVKRLTIPDDEVPVGSRKFAAQSCGSLTALSLCVEKETSAAYEIWGSRQLTATN